MIGNIVGESFEEYVKNQIKTRQEVYGSGLNNNRTPEQLNYLNSKLSWVKMASSVEFTDEYPSSFISGSQEFLNTQNSQKNNIVYHGEATKKLTEVFGGEVEKFKGKQLASKAILFNGLTDLSQPSPSLRSGITKNNQIWDDNTYVAYGLGGLDFGIQPMPGIISMNIKHINRGSVRQAEVNIKAFNKKQFEIIELLYLRLGYSMLLEWGNNTYISNSNNKEDISTTLIDNFWFQDNQQVEPLDILRKIEEKRREYEGNYDAFFGRVINFKWSINPDGSYDILINIHGLGSVIESLTVNIIDPNAIINQEVQDIAGFKGDKISNFLNAVRLQPKIAKTQKQLNRAKATTRVQELKESLKELQSQILPQTEEVIKNFSNEIIDLNENTQVTVTGGFKVQKNFKDTPYNYYIRFGAFLSFLRDYVLLRLTNDQGSSSFPILNINNDPNINIMYGEDKQFSIDPKICIVNNPSVLNYLPKNNAPSKTNFSSIFNQFEPWYVGAEISYALPMNIYLNFEFILSSLENNLNSKGNLSVYKFLENICNGINKALGGINNLQPIVDESTNSITIIDQTTVPGKNQLLNNDKEDPILELYGYSGSASNFVKNFNFQTEVFPDLATTIAIGATANGTVIGEDATAFSKWNLGLVDRYNKEIYTPSSISLDTKNPLDEKSIQALTDEALRSLVEELGPIKSYLFLSPEERKRRNTLRKEVSRRALKVKQDNEKFYLENNYNAYLQEAFGYETNQLEYFSSNENFIKRGYQVLKNNLLISQYFRSNQTQNPSTFSGFLPLNLSVELEGISGIRIYNKLVISDKFLPYSYPKNLEFLVKGVSHSLSNNSWVTQLETISIPKTSPIKTSQETTSILPELPLFFEPVIGMPLRSDGGGSGEFGASRDGGTRSHLGYDIKTQEGGGTIIYSPIKGQIKQGYTKRGFKKFIITGQDEYTGIIVEILYVNPNSQTFKQLTQAGSSKFVTLGQELGTSVDLNKTPFVPKNLQKTSSSNPKLAGGGAIKGITPTPYPSSVEDHIHFEVFYSKPGEYLDPNPKAGVITYTNTL